MVNAMFFGMALLLVGVAAHRLVGRATPRPAGSLAIGSLLASCALAFLVCTPLVIHAADSVVPRLSRLMSNSASIAAASVVAASFRMNLTPEEAGRRMRQALRQSRSTRRGSVRFGLRLAAAGCVFGLVYAGYKTSVLTALALGRPLVGRDGPKCSSLIAPPCVFSATAPALAVLLIGVGRTGWQPADAVTSEIFPRGGDLRAEAEWLVAVADAYAPGDTLGIDRRGDGRLDHVGA